MWRSGSAPSGRGPHAKTRHRGSGHSLYLRRLRIVGAAGTNRRDVTRALEAAKNGQLRAIIERVMPLREAAVAHRLLEQNQTLGKIILDPTLS
ncbi:MAG: zinc-binding dehydrogenase [Candidatus Binatia bacterium]